MNSSMKLKNKSNFNKRTKNKIFKKIKDQILNGMREFQSEEREKRKKKKKRPLLKHHDINNDTCLLT